MIGENCPCRRVNCPRHGDCAACRAHHRDSQRKRPCERAREKAARAQRPRRRQERTADNGD